MIIKLKKNEITKTVGFGQYDKIDLQHRYMCL